MASSFATYSPPGIKQSELILPNSGAPLGQPFGLCLIGTGSRNKRVANEAVVRGLVKAESLTLASAAGSLYLSGVGAAHTATLSLRANRKLENTTLYRSVSGIKAELPDNYFQFEPAYILGSVTSTVNLLCGASAGSRANAIALEMDKILAVTIVLNDQALPSAIGNLMFAVNGTTVSVTRGTGSFVTDGLVVGGKVYISSAEDSANNGTFTLLSVSTTVITFTNASGVANADDDAAVIGFSTVSRIGRQLTVTTPLGGSAGATASMAEIAAAINIALSSTDGTTLGYGSSYANVATVSASKLKITSPLNPGDKNSDVRVFVPMTDSGTSIIFGSSTLDAASVIRIADSVYSGSATYSIDYVSESDTDSLTVTSGIQSLVSVGSTKSGTNFQVGRKDYVLNSATVDWSVNSAGYIYGVTGPFNLSAIDTIIVDVDNVLDTYSLTAQVTIDLVGLSLAPIGYVANPGGTAGDASTVANVVTNINAVLASALGPRYKAVATSATHPVTSATVVKLTGVSVGRIGTVTVREPSTSPGACTTVFGGEVFGASVGTGVGAGARPALGATYYVTYDYTRPDTDYNKPVLHFGPDSARAQVGSPSVSTFGFNPLANAADIAFENKASFLYTIQINDTTVPGTPTRQEVKDALDAATVFSTATEICIVDEPGTRLDVHVDEVDHLETECSSDQGHPRRIHAGMAANTVIGDRATVNSWVGRAASTFQVSPTSPGRGRIFLNVPPQLKGLTRTITLDDNSSVRRTMDSTYLGVAFAARRCALEAASNTMTRRQITGFNLDDITEALDPKEIKQLAGQGCNVFVFDGSIKCLEAMSTEGASGAPVDKFLVDSTSYCKDIINAKVTEELDANVVTLVPYDVSSFLFEIRLLIAGVINREISDPKGACGPYVDAAGNRRVIDLLQDIQVLQDPDTKTKFNFRYAYNLRYPFLRGEGQYSVDQALPALPTQ